MPDEFKQTDFVQVHHWFRHWRGEISQTWRNALYVGMENDRHVVIYTNGEKEILNQQQQIRKVNG
jgi:hypothetical protein